VVVELDSNDKMISKISKSSVQGMDIVLKLSLLIV
jgi:hypothetical protein